jgi:hypothetical protein
LKKKKKSNSLSEVLFISLFGFPSNFPNRNPETRL